MQESTLPMVWEYLKATSAYWWFLFVGVLMPLPDIWKHFHPQGRELPLPRWLRWTAALLCVSFAQFLAYRDQTTNLARVIEDKRQFSIRINDLNAELREEKQKFTALSQKVPALRESKNSLRRRTMQLADEMQKYFLNRANDPNRPPFAVPNSSDPNPSEEQKRAIERYRKYEQETLDYYFAHYRDRMIGIIKEYDAKGVKTGYLESTARQFPPVVMMPGSAGEGTYMDALYQFRELAYHLDGEGNLIVIAP